MDSEDKVASKTGDGGVIVTSGLTQGAAQQQPVPPQAIADDKDGKTEKKRQNKQDENDPISDWVVNTVKLEKYKNAFLKFGYASLESIVETKREKFSKRIERVLEDVDGEEKIYHVRYHAQFMLCYDDLGVRCTTNKQNGMSIFCV